LRDGTAVEIVDHATGLQTIKNAFHKIWADLHNMSEPSQAKLDEWAKSLPASCECGDGYAKIVKTIPPRFNDWFAWTFDLRNAVRVQKLGLPPWDWQAALRQWRPQFAYPKQPPLSGLIAVTSLAPHRFDRQTVCLDSWRRFGLEITSVNSQDEIESMRNLYPVSKWVTAEFKGTPKINSLIDVAASEDIAILVINADIEIYGDQNRLLDLVAKRKNAIGIRHNYETQPGESKQEPWGLDAFLVYPEQLANISRVDFSIGKPMWDYWIAVELEAMGECEWIEEPYFYHRSHPVAWSQEECTAAHEAYAKRFKPKDWAAWRTSKPSQAKKVIKTA